MNTTFWGVFELGVNANQDCPILGLLGGTVYPTQADAEYAMRGWIETYPDRQKWYSVEQVELAQD